MTERLSERERIVQHLKRMVCPGIDGTERTLEIIADWHLAEVKRIVANTRISTLESIMVRGAPAYLRTDFDDMPI